ncbi:MAG: hypothetical protein M1829_004054 [Trizodia sp. TS-e1964]|nr:MAG: hypothetical protein M1829_004054 [Trizodia sp. TS-e1964]
MPANRRLKAFALVCILLVLTILYYTAGVRQARSHDFYTSTIAKINEKAAAAAEAVRPTIDVDDMAAVGDRLKEAAKEAKLAAERKTPKPAGGDQAVQNPIGPPPAADEEGKSVAGRKKMKPDGTPPKWETEKTETDRVKQLQKEKAESEETPEDHAVEFELDSIFKKSPIIIISKSYCPYSLKAKGILLDRYTIDPRPYVVELDKHPLGAALQALLAKTTGRRTVPNVLVQGRSIGGGDEIEALHQRNALAETIRSMGGSRVTSAELRDLKRQRKA